VGGTDFDLPLFAPNNTLEL